MDNLNLKQATAGFNDDFLKNQLDEAIQKKQEILNKENRTVKDNDVLSKLDKAISEMSKSLGVDTTSINEKSKPEIVESFNEDDDFIESNKQQKLNIKSIDFDDDILTQPKTKKISDNLYDYDEELDDSFEVQDYNESYDMVGLPSKGLIYSNPSLKRGRIPVSYITASDEDMLTSPNLYTDDQIMSILLRKKILDKSINPDELCNADRDAILLMLRTSAYGVEFPVRVKNPYATSEEDLYFDSVADLSEIKMKEFNLKPDKNGLFSYKLPKTQDVVKFRFLNYRDEINYKKMIQMSNETLKKDLLLSSKNAIEEIINFDKSFDPKKKKSIFDAMSLIDEYTSDLSDSDEIKYTRTVTYKTQKHIVSINDNTDRKYIKEYVNNMPAFDSLSLRKYIAENTPQLDFTVTITPPESVGGGSLPRFQTTLELDSALFLNFT